MNYPEYCKKKRSIEKTLEYLNSLDCKLLNGDTGEKPDRNMNYTQINELILCEALLNVQYENLIKFANEKFKGGIH
jgi:hypothetical protein